MQTKPMQAAAQPAMEAAAPGEMRAAGIVSPVRAVIRASAGNFLEMYDFTVYAYYASYIARAIFPASSEFASLMLTLGTFGAGYLMRPLGAIVLGAYMDRHGRRKGLILGISLMAVGTVAIACTPSYASIGIMAPLAVLLGRLLQGFSAGIVVGGTSVYLAEIATPGHRGFFSSWQSAGQQVAVVIAALLGVTLSAIVPARSMSAWGWRLPFALGCLIIPVILWLRRSMEETPAFLAREKKPHIGMILRGLAENWGVVSIGTLLSIMTTVCFYLITAYTPTYGRVVLHLTDHQAFFVTLCVGVSNFVWVPIGGAISDVTGRKASLLFFSIATLFTAYPAMLWMVRHPSYVTLLAVELWFSCIFGGYNGAMVPLLTEIMPADVRGSGFSLAFSIATGVFGGFTPAVCTYLIHVTGNRAIPAVWLCAAAVAGLVATLICVWKKLPALAWDAAV